MKRIMTVFICLLFSLILCFCGGCKKKNVPLPPTEVKVSFIVKSSYDKSDLPAEIYVNGEKYGDAPCTFPLKIGMKHVLIETVCPGYRYSMHHLQRVTLQTPSSFTLELDPMFSVMFLSSIPSGASLSFDNDPKGVTPLALITLMPGKHLLNLSYPGHAPVNKSVIIDPWGTPEKLEVNLSSRMGKLVVNSNIDNSEVLINDESVGSTRYEGDLTEGTYKVRITKPGYASAERQVIIKASETETVTMNLSELMGVIEVTPMPAHAKVFIDDELIGIGKQKSNPLSPGPHKVRVECENHDAEEEDVMLSRDGLLQLSYSLEPNTGSIRVLSSPGGLTVRVDGKVYGVTEVDSSVKTQALPFTIKNLSSGNHVVTLTGRSEKNPPLQLTETVSVPKRGEVMTSKMSGWIPNVKVRTSKGLIISGFLKTYDEKNIKIEPNKGYIRTFKRNEVDLKFMDISDK